MTEQEWLTSTEPQLMVEFLSDNTSERKLRFFAVGCCRQIWHLLVDDRSREAVELMEGFADGVIEVSKIDDARRDAYKVLSKDFSHPYQSAALAAVCVCFMREWKAACDTANSVVEAFGTGTADFVKYYSNDELQTEEQTAQKVKVCELLRDIFGNPFRPVAFDPVWRKPSVTAVAQAIYSERRFADLPILADALEEGGCTSDDILDHCRSGGEHVLGCWVVDLVLEKK